MIQNYMELLVENALEDELKTSPERYANICQCPSCLAFIKATALNTLRPFYVTRLTGEVFGAYQNKEAQFQSDVLVAIGKGIDAAMSLGHNVGAVR